MDKKEIISKVKVKLDKKELFALSDKCIKYINPKSEWYSLQAKKASFFFELGGNKYSLEIGMNTGNEEDMEKYTDDKHKLFIIPFSKHRVIICEHKEKERWFFGGFDSEDDNMKILGYMEFGAFNVLVFFNSETETPFIRLEDWGSSADFKLLYQAFCAILFEKEKEGGDGFEDIEL